MLSLEQIRDDQLRAAARAAREGKVPLVSWPQDTAHSLGASMPYLGDYVPEGWELKQTYLVDSSGLGLESELALTMGQFERVAQEHVGNGWAVTEAGEFQVVVGRYEKTDDHPSKKAMGNISISDPFYPIGEDW